MSAPAPSGEHPQPKRYGKLIVIAAVLLLAGFGLWATGGKVSNMLEVVVEREGEIFEFQLRHPWVVLALAYVAYTLVTGVSLPGAAPMTLVYGWFFAKAYGQVTGLFIALGVISFASTSGATLAFLLSRYLFRDVLQTRFAAQLEKFSAALQREGAFYLFALRLIPAVPFWVINLVMGLTPMRARTFWGVSQIGMLPGTFVYVYAGTELTGVSQLLDGDGPSVPWRLLVAFALLGIFPLIAKKAIAKFRPIEADTESADSAAPQ